MRRGKLLRAALTARAPASSGRPVTTCA